MSSVHIYEYFYIYVYILISTELKTEAMGRTASFQIGSKVNGTKLLILENKTTGKGLFLIKNI